MSVINRIEIASLLNKHGDISTPWEAKMRHLVLNLRGQSTAMNMENGFGKTTLSDALIGILSRDRTLVRKTRKKLSPSKDGHPWSHIRVEFSYSSGHVGQSDLLAAAGDSVGGTEQWVFGMYGHSDTEPGYYYYQGRLEELPVSAITADKKLQLYSNKDFQNYIRHHNTTIERPRDRESWLDAISSHISRKELEQLASFQKEGGADKSQIFNAIKPRPGEKADQAFFYDVLAPQILAGASQGETDESEEFIEDLIINSGQKVSDLRHQINETSSDLQRNINKASRLNDLDRAGDKLTHSRNERNTARKELIDLASCLQTMTLSGLPGIVADPSDKPSHKNDPVSRLAAELAIRPGETEPLVALSTLAKLTGSSARKLEEYFEKSQLGGHRHDRTPITYNPRASWRSGKSTRLYPVHRVIELLDKSQLFNDDADRVSKLVLLADAADHFFNLDTNPFRENYLADQNYLETLQKEVKELKDRKLELEHQREDLETRDKDFTDNETVYSDALKDGLFTEAELENARDTQEKVLITANAVEKSYQEFLQEKGFFFPKADLWHQFVREQGNDQTPETVLQEKDDQYAQLEQRLSDQQAQLEKDQNHERNATGQWHQSEQTRLQLSNKLQHLNDLQTDFLHIKKLFPDEDVDGLSHRLEQQLQHLRQQERSLAQQQNSDQSEHLVLNNLFPDYQIFRKHFPEQKPEGLISLLSAEKNDLEHRNETLKRNIAELERLTSCLEQFRIQFPSEQPAQWLENARSKYPELLTEQVFNRNTISDLERQLTDLENNPVSPGSTELECENLLKANSISHQSLHQVISELFDQQDIRRSVWLTQAHNFLFAPVINDLETAVQAAEIFSAKQLSMPVFTRQSLQTVADYPDAATLMGAVIGFESMAVRALLDPQYIEQLRTRLQSDLDAHNIRRIDIEQKLDIYQPDSASFTLTEAALLAEKENTVTKLPQKQAELDINQQTLIKLVDALTPESQKIIRSSEHFLEAGGEATMASLDRTLTMQAEKLESINKDINQINSQLSGENRKRLLQAEEFIYSGGNDSLNQLQNDLELASLNGLQLQEQLNTLSESIERTNQQIHLLRHQTDTVYAGGEKDRLLSLDDFLTKGGPDFIRKADETQSSWSAKENWRSRE